MWVRCVGGNSLGISGKGMEADGEEGKLAMKGGGEGDDGVMIV